MELSFVLVEAAVPENVGFAARAIKTMGFDKLVLVNACDHLSKGARTTGYGSHDILESAIAYQSLTECLSHFDLTIATTAKKRLTRHDLFTPTEMLSLIEKKSGTVENVALVFGSEEHGLTGDQLELCDLVSGIPLATKYPSLNLAQAVLLYAYEFSAISKLKFKKREEVIGETEQMAVKNRAIEMLDKLGVDRQPSLYQRLKDRLMTAPSEDIRLILSLIKYLEKRL